DATAAAAARSEKSRLTWTRESLPGCPLHRIPQYFLPDCSDRAMTESKRAWLCRSNGVGTNKFGDHLEFGEMEELLIDVDLSPLVPLEISDDVLHIVDTAFLHRTTCH